MKKCHLLFTIICFPAGVLTAQLGLTTAPTKTLAPQWQVLVENYLTGRKTPFLKNGITASLDYTFQLKASEWEFSPALHAMRVDFLHDPDFFSVTALGFRANFNFTPLKKKQNREWPKGRLYFQLSPGLDFVRMNHTGMQHDGPAPHSGIISKDQKWAFNGGISILLELKLSNLLSVAPMTGIRYYPNLRWKGFTKTISNSAFTDEYDQVNWRHHLLPGLRIGLNL